ncbi:hypothetical protein CFP56_022605 [Quercus suber]|uniref:DUF4283 domain-containing protein n=1 Tax=Quercus suber TaxID=58331 RepID=A0AAW0LZ23_QUESU
MAEDVIESMGSLKLTSEEEEDIQVSDEGRMEGIDSCVLSLIGKFLTCKPFNRRAAKNTLRRAWGLDKELQIAEVGNNLFQFKFQSEYELERILRGGPWTFDNQLLMLTRWRTGMSANNVVLEHASLLLKVIDIYLCSTSDWKFAAEQFVKMLPDKVIVHCSERNVSKLTLDGVDVMGERLVEEVLELIQRKPNLSMISFVAHSVGGLVARYAIGRLYRPPKSENVEDSTANRCEEDSRATIGGLKAMNFITVATPHLGSRGTISFGVPAFEKAATLVIHWIFRRTGQHLFLVDNDQGKPPLLKHIVGWRTSCIRRNSDLPRWEDTLNEKYPHVVYEEHCKAYEAEECEATSIEDHGSDKLEGL